MGGGSDLATSYKYWGKAKPATDGQAASHHLLVFHSLDVAAVGQILLSRHAALKMRVFIILCQANQLTG